MFFVFFFKQKTAYEMRISDWSSDVCSSDLRSWPYWRTHESLVRLPVRSCRHSGLRTAGSCCSSCRSRSFRNIPRIPAWPDRRGSRASPDRPAFWLRSEEHTSELQSLMRISYAVFCLKKKKTSKTNYNMNKIEQP